MWTFLGTSWRWIWRGVTFQSEGIAAPLIASQVDFDQALAVAGDGRREILANGRTSASAIDQISAAVGARLVLAEQMTHEERVRYVQHLQNRYRVAVGSAAYAHYSAGVPKKVFEDKAELAAELQTLSYRLRLTYAISFTRDRHLSRIRATCFWLLIAAFVGGLAAITWEHLANFSASPINFAVVGLLGLGGALTSIARRANRILADAPLEADPVMQASALQEGSASLFVAGLTGPVFAIILALIFMGADFKIGNLTPVFLDHRGTGSPDPDFKVLQYGFWLKSQADAARLVMWAFVAGFAEQFVPDVLDRFSKLSSKSG